MRPELADHAAPPVQLLVESQSGQGKGGASRFLNTAQHLPAGTRTVVFLIDDGVHSGVGDQPDVAHVIKTGGSVYADEFSLAERNIPASELESGVESASMDAVAALLFDPAVRVVWH